MKKIIFLVLIVLLISAGGFFWWQEGQKDVKELNKNLPEGIRVAKSFLGEYKVINKIDGYEFKVPKEWNGLEEIRYVPEGTEQGYTASSIALKGKEGGSRIIAIDRFKIENPDINLGDWAKTNFETFGLTGDFSKNNVGEFETVKTREEVHLLGMAVYFFKKDSAIYSITCGSEEFIREIIANGKW